MDKEDIMIAINETNKKIEKIEKLILYAGECADIARKEGLYRIYTKIDKIKVAERDSFHVGLCLVSMGTDFSLVKQGLLELERMEKPDSFERLYRKVGRIGALGIQWGANPGILQWLMDCCVPREYRAINTPSRVANWLLDGADWSKEDFDRNKALMSEITGEIVDDENPRGHDNIEAETISDDDGLRGPEKYYEKEDSLAKRISEAE